MQNMRTGLLCKVVAGFCRHQILVLGCFVQQKGQYSLLCPHTGSIKNCNLLNYLSDTITDHEFVSKQWHDIFGKNFGSLFRDWSKSSDAERK